MAHLSEGDYPVFRASLYRKLSPFIRHGRTKNIIWFDLADNFLAVVIKCHDYPSMYCL